MQQLPTQNRPLCYALSKLVPTSLFCIGLATPASIIVQIILIPLLVMALEGNWASPAAMVPVLEKGQVILEVKFDDFLPGYLADVLRDIPKANMAISKFAMCMNLQ